MREIKYLVLNSGDTFINGIKVHTNYHDNFDEQFYVIIEENEICISDYIEDILNIYDDDEYDEDFFEKVKNKKKLYDDENEYDFVIYHVNNCNYDDRNRDVRVYSNLEYHIFENLKCDKLIII
jgi:hypothetical protein